MSLPQVRWKVRAPYWKVCLTGPANHVKDALHKFNGACHMSNISKSVLWAMAIIAVALFGAFGVIPHETSKVLVFAMPALAIASLNARGRVGARMCA
jgi:hypothetical protein